MNKQLNHLIISMSGVRENEIKPDARLYEDLGIYGDDAIELMIAYSSQFKVYISNFMAADYFQPEGDTLLPAIIGMITGNKKKYKILMVSHLEKGILAGRLNEEIINELVSRSRNQKE
jgi:acyl carrier protein